MNKEILVFGTGALSVSVYHLVKDINEINIIGFIVDDAYYTINTFLDLPVYKLSDVAPKANEIICCIGYKSMRDRKQRYLDLKNRGFKFCNVVHPSVTLCENVSLGDNNIVFPQVCIEHSVRIGNNNIFWSQTLIGHDAKVENHNYVSAKVLIGGNVVVKENSFLGNAIAMINDVIIEDETYVVAGSFIFNSTEKYSKYFGNPARKVSEHKIDGIKI